MLETLCLLTLGLLHPGVEAAATANKALPFFPTYFSYGGYPRIQTNISWGTPKQTPPIPTIVDTGSPNFWVYQANATVNYGSRYSFTQGPCNVTAHPAFDNTASRTATKGVDVLDAYSYGGNGKFVYSYEQVNDSMRFGNAKVPVLKNTRVGLSNWTVVKQGIANNTCNDDVFTYDHSILGLSPAYEPQFDVVGPSWRQDAFDNSLIQSKTMSMWMDAPPKAYDGTFRGSVLLGGVPTSKYSGKLVQVPLDPPTDPYVGYYVKTPTFSVNSISNTNKFKKLKADTDDSPNCLLDSGTGNDALPIDTDTFLNATGLIMYDGYPAYNGSCASMPTSLALNATFAGVNSSESVTVSIPLRNYARGNADYLDDSANYCSLSMLVDSYESCVLAAPFFTALFLAVNDDVNQLGIAQGGVSKGAKQGTNGLGPVTTVGKGQSLPFN